MDPTRLSISVWSWLPAFRAVAATEHLPTASKRLGLSPSALSRTVRQLEAEVGRPLFHRRGRTLSLNADGKIFYQRVVEAFASVAEGLERVDGARTAGPLHAGASGPLAQAILALALRTVLEAHPDLLPYVYEHGADEAAELLNTGRLDVWVGPVAPRGTGVTAVCLGEASVGLYVGRGHPLYAAEAPTRNEIAQHGFVELLGSGEQTVVSASKTWRVEAHVHQPHVALHLCALGRLLALFSEPVARPYVAAGLLRLLPVPGLASTPLFLAWASGKGTSARVNAIERASRAELASRGARSQPEQGPVSAPASPVDWLSDGDILVTHGEFEAARHTYQQAWQASLLRGPSLIERGRLASRLAFVELHRGDYVGAIREVNEALEQLGSAPGVEPTATSLAAVAAMACCFQNDLAAASRWLARARDTLDRDPGVNLVATSEARIRLARAEGNVWFSAGRPLDAIHAYERGQQACREAGDSWEHSIALYNLAEVSLYVGDAPRAAALLDQAEAEKRAINDRWGLGYVHALRAQLSLLAGDFSRALDELRAGLVLGLGRADPGLGSMLTLCLGQAQLASGDLVAAAHAFSLVLSEKAATVPVARVVRANLGLATVHLRQGSIAMARTLVECARALAPSSHVRLAEIDVIMGDICLAEGDPAQAASLYRTALTPLSPRPASPLR